MDSLNLLRSILELGWPAIVTVFLIILYRDWRGDLQVLNTISARLAVLEAYCIEEMDENPPKPPKVLPEYDR